MAKMIVICSGDASTWFDRDYYAKNHFELARTCWEQYGLQSAEAFFPYIDSGNWQSIGIYTFSSEQGVHEALRCEKTKLIMDDVTNFTNAPVVLRSLFTEF